MYCVVLRGNVDIRPLELGVALSVRWNWGSRPEVDEFDVLGLGVIEQVLVLDVAVVDPLGE